MKRLLTDVVVAADRMRDGWAEGDEGVKSQLWRALHAAAEAAHEVVYPLPGAVPCADGSLVHEFQGQPTCPACGWAGIEA